MVEHIGHSPKKCSVSFLFFWNIGTEKLEKFKISNNKTSVFKTNSSRVAFENLSNKDRSKLSETAQDFSNQFAMLYKVKNTMRLYL